MDLPLFLILAALGFGSFYLAKISDWKIGFVGCILLWLLLIGLMVSIYPRMDYVTTSILIGSIGILIWVIVKPKPVGVKKKPVRPLFLRIDEASMDIDLKMLPLFLQQITPLFESGFTDNEIELLQQSAAKLAVYENAFFEFQVQHRGFVVPLHVRIFGDNIDVVGLYFFTAKGLAAKIRREMDIFGQAVELMELLLPDYDVPPVIDRNLVDSTRFP